MAFAATYEKTSEREIFFAHLHLIYRKKMVPTFDSIPISWANCFQNIMYTEDSKAELMHMEAKECNLKAKSPLMLQGIDVLGNKQPLLSGNETQILGYLIFSFEC